MHFGAFDTPSPQRIRWPTRFYMADSMTRDASGPVTRAETRELLAAWIAGEVDPRTVWTWAQHAREGQSFEDELVRDIVDVLETLPHDLIVVADAEVMVYGLGNPADEADLAQNLLWNHLDGIDEEARRAELRDDPFYGPFCGAIT